MTRASKVDCERSVRTAEGRGVSCLWRRRTIADSRLLSNTCTGCERSPVPGAPRSRSHRRVCHSPPPGAMPMRPDYTTSARRSGGK
jgi:hypothetical protein